MVVMKRMWRRRRRPMLMINDAEKEKGEEDGDLRPAWSPPVLAAGQAV